MTELKPCPFCGSEPFRPVPMYADNGDTGWAAWCSKRRCSTVGPLRKSEKLAAAAWNTRTPQADKEEK